jgi:hypothetical protein
MQSISMKTSALAALASSSIAQQGYNSGTVQQTFWLAGIATSDSGYLYATGKSSHGRRTSEIQQRGLEL